MKKFVNRLLWWAGYVPRERLVESVRHRALLREKLTKLRLAGKPFTTVDGDDYILNDLKDFLVEENNQARLG